MCQVEGQGVWIYGLFLKIYEPDKILKRRQFISWNMNEVDGKSKKKSSFEELFWNMGQGSIIWGILVHHRFFRDIVK